MSEYKPGTVALATVRGVPNMRVFRGQGVWSSADYAEDRCGGEQDLWSDSELTDVRPLVVIDPEDREQVERMLRAWDDTTYSSQALLDRIPRMQRALHKFANPTPPKPAEPTGLGAVVEDAQGVPWVRCENVDLEPHWYARNKMRKYESIDVVRVLSEGVTPC